MESSARTSVISAMSYLPTPICSIQILEHSHLKETCDVFSEGIGARNVFGMERDVITASFPLGGLDFVAPFYSYYL